MHSLGLTYSFGILIIGIIAFFIFGKKLFNGFIKYQTMILVMILIFSTPLTLLINAPLSFSVDYLKWFQGILSFTSLILLSSIFALIYGEELEKNSTGIIKFPIFTFLAIYSHIILVFKFSSIYPPFNDFAAKISIFTESSHIIFVTSVFLFIKYSSISRIYFLLYFAAFTMFAFLTHSLLGLASLFFVAFVLSKKIHKIFIVIIFVGLAVGSSSEKLAFDNAENNLTAAVYLSGWERAFLNLRETNLFGLGLNQFGVYGDQGYFIDFTYLLSGGMQVNRYDGSFMFAKLTGELGVFTIILAFYFIYLWFKCFTNRFYTNNFFSLAIITSFLSLFFLRSPGVVCGASVLIICLLTHPKLFLRSADSALKRGSNEGDGLTRGYRVGRDKIWLT